MKVLVIQIKMIGDVLASTVIFETLKKELPNSELHYLIEKNSFAVVQNNPNINKIIYYDKTQHSGFKGMYRLSQILKAEKYDIVIDVYGTLKSLIPTYLSGAKKRIGTYKWYSKFCLTEVVFPETNCNGTANKFRLLLAKTALQKDIETIYPKIHLLDSEIENAKNLITKTLDRNKPIVMISILGSSANKSLPKPYMASIIDSMAENNSAIQFIFNYMPNQIEEAKTIFNLCKEETKKQIHFDFYSKGLREFLAVLSQCNALVGNEGGATNMAKSLNIATFTIYAPWINKKSWNILEETGCHDNVHLEDYFPELYQKKHPKNFKEKALEWYDKLEPKLFTEKLKKFTDSNI